YLFVCCSVCVYRLYSRFRAKDCTEESAGECYHTTWQGCWKDESSERMAPLCTVRAQPWSSGSGEQIGMLVIGHRGASGHAPENTLVAFRKAVALGATSIDTDSQLSRDAQFVAIHDETV